MFRLLGTILRFWSRR